MTKNNLKAVFSIAALIVFVGIFIIAYKDNKDDEKLLNEHGKYEIGTVTKKVRTYRAKIYVHYDFMVNDKTYSGSRLYYTTDGVVKIGDKYKVVYYSKNPKVNKILFNEKIMN